MEQFDEISIKLTKSLSSLEKKNNGIFFTPKSIIQQNFQILNHYRIMERVENILEPSCGSGQYIDYIIKNHKDKNITGIELNKTIYEEISKVLEYNSKNCSLINQNFLEYKSESKYDLIIGNPPYFVIPKSYSEIGTEFYDGRPNIFVLFIVHSLSLLNDNGVLSFILPKNFLNCIYYDKLRKFINENYMILNITDCSNDKYIETDQDTIIFIVMKSKDEQEYNKNWTLGINGYTTFNTYENIIQLKELLKESTNLDSLGFNVKVGNIVWNQHKDLLTDDEDATLLLYSSNIVDNQLMIKNFKNDEKKQYIKKDGNIEPILVLNRGYGKGKYNFEYGLINIDKPFLVENHLICITKKSKIDNVSLLEEYNKIISSLKNEKTLLFVKLYFGNNSINTNELKFVLPIYS